MSAFTLRMIALVSMALDHIGFRFLSDPWLRQVGRLAFPLYCFLIAEGFAHTRNRERYAFRLLLLALISEIPYNLFLRNRIFYPASQNVFFTLLVGLLAAWWVWYFRGSWGLGLIGVTAAAVFAYSWHSDYGFYGVLLIVSFSVLRDRPQWRDLVFLLLVGIFCVYSFQNGSSQQWALTQLLGCLALIPIFLYNGKPGPRLFKWGFYLFYPVHLLLFWILSRL